jgi:capsular polysaccharide export protein
VTGFRKLAGGSEPLEGLPELLRKVRVGGTYWAAQPALPSDYVLVRSAWAAEAATRIADGRPVVVWDSAACGALLGAAVLVVFGDCDPWHMLEGASALVIEEGDELSLIASLLGIDCFSFKGSRLQPMHLDATALVSREFAGVAFENPFRGQRMGVLEAIELCGFWRRLIDSNREIAAGAGFAFWKQAHVAPLLWNGSAPFRFMRSPARERLAGSVAVWRARTSPETLSEIQSSGASIVEVEDGFVRSRGLGADCVPPLSITVDRLGPHFDPAQPSELELLLETGEFDAMTLDRARELRRLIVEAGIGKYGRGKAAVARPDGNRRLILVPGQVEDDRAVQAGGCGLVSNLDLLRKVREDAPDAYILYKPHPDVVAGHRRGSIPERLCLRHADEVVGEVPIGSLIETVDEVHVNTSLAGFEALLRLKPVTTHGVPFYAGWGLTRDLGPVPSRRTRLRTLDELVAAVLLLYPRYLDPVTGLPCPAEIVVSRLSVEPDADPGVVVAMRRLQGKFMRRLRSLVQ